MSAAIVTEKIYDAFRRDGDTTRIFYDGHTFGGNPITSALALAALDVYEQEPPGDHPLLKLEQVICTPHLGASTGEAQENVAVGIAEQIKEFLLAGGIRNAVNTPQITCELMSEICHYLTLAERLGSFFFFFF